MQSVFYGRSTLQFSKTYLYLAIPRSGDGPIPMRPTPDKQNPKVSIGYVNRCNQRSCSRINTHERIHVRTHIRNIYIYIYIYILYYISTPTGLLLTSLVPSISFASILSELYSNVEFLAYLAELITLYCKGQCSVYSASSCLLLKLRLRLQLVENINHYVPVIMRLITWRPI